MIQAIVAYDRNRGIGRSGELPWQGELPADLRHFRRTTLGHAVIMGRTTFDSLAKPLSERHNIVVTSRPIENEEIISAPNIKAAIEQAERLDSTPFVIGGAALYAAALPYVQRVIATEIDAVFDADTFFPTLDKTEWALVSKENIPADNKNIYDMTRIIYERHT